MATKPLKYANQFFTTTLNVGGGINNSQTTGIVVASVAGVDISKPGIALLNYANPLDTSKAEWIFYTSINGSNELQGVSRTEEGFSAKAHANGAAVAFPFSETHINQFAEMFDSIGLDIKHLASTPANPDSGRSKLFFDNSGILKKLTSAGVVSTVESTVVDSFTVLVDGATVTIDVSANKKFELTLGGNRTLQFSNESGLSGKVLLLRLIQDGTGSRTVTWPNKASTFATTDVSTGTEELTVNRDIPTGTPIKFSSTGGVPTGLTAGTTYYAIRVSGTVIKVATSVANAQAGTAIDITGTGTGTHTITTEIRWAGNSAPTLTTGKHRRDLIGIILADVTNGIYEGCVVSQDI